jgi:uncharacterized protein (TIGR00255 family)
MTGHGRGTAASGGVRAEAEIASVNRRQLEVRLALPKTLAALEPRVHGMLQRSLSRGAVSVAVKISLLDPEGGGMRVDTAAARGYVRALRGAARSLRLKDDLTAQALLALPDIVCRQSPAEDPERVWPPLRRALGLALRRMVAMREAEGEALARDLGRRLIRLERVRAAVAARAPRAAARQRERLRARLREAGVSAVASASDILREAVLLADRADIAEELTRLESHLAQCGALLRKGGKTGRTLDFLCQELLREINTIGAKANDAGIAHRVIAFKSELERVREQVQNVE